jgi:uncharacterized membrane protein YgdD (TMEM256/DUF423 family)
MDRTLVRIGALLSFLAVALGAFAKHTLEKSLSPHSLEIFDTGARYHALHALGVIVIGFLVAFGDAKRLRLAGWLLIVGIAIFSGSLYALALTGQKMLGALAPLGGLSLMAGWVTLSLGFPKQLPDQATDAKSWAPSQGHP